MRLLKINILCGEGPTLRSACRRKQANTMLCLQLSDLVSSGGDNRYAKDASNTGPQGLLIPGAHRAWRRKHTAGAKGLGRSKNGSHISGILESRGDNQQRQSLPFEEIRYPVYRPLDQRSDPLRGLRLHRTGEDVRCQVYNLYFVRHSCGEMLPFHKEDGAKNDAAAERLFNKVLAFNCEQAP